MQSDNPTTGRQSSAHISLGSGSTVGGDVFGGDKYVVTTNSINLIAVSAQEAFELLGQFQRLPETTTPQTPAAKTTRRKTKIKPHRELLYQLDLGASQVQISQTLSRWRFVEEFPGPPQSAMPIAIVVNKTLGIGQTNSTTFDSPPVPELTNCSVECELRIKSDNGEPKRWAGFRVRGWRDDIQFGYLVYLRGQGKVELYRAQEVLGGENEIIVQDTKEAWTKIRLDIQNSQIRVWVNGKLHFTVKDSKFRDKGMIYLHTFGTHAQFRNLRIYRLVR